MRGVISSFFFLQGEAMRCVFFIHYSINKDGHAPSLPFPCLDATEIGSWVPNKSIAYLGT
jgi:hypothetical protein